MRQFLHEIITEAGHISLNFRKKLSTLTVNRKQEKDLVTEADIAVENYLVDRIKQQFPTHAILGEESGEHQGTEYRWIIDPIDGTTSFLHGQPFYSISVAVERNGELILGAVNAPVLDEIYEAEKDQGAFLNGLPIEVSRRNNLTDSVLATGFACLREDMLHNNLDYFNVLMPHLRDVRRYGSAAIDLAYVACGRLEGFWELNLKIYDVAAGFVILREAGGQCSDFSGRNDHLPDQALCTNGLIHNDIIQIFSAMEK